MTYISRNPFAREELHRASVKVVSRSCDYCGQVRFRRKGDDVFAIPYLYQYRTETDGGRKYEHRGLFCNKSCHDAYHNWG